MENDPRMDRKPAEFLNGIASLHFQNTKLIRIKPLGVRKVLPNERRRYAKTLSWTAPLLTRNPTNTSTKRERVSFALIALSLALRACMNENVALSS